MENAAELSTAQLQEIERQCIAKFRQKAAQIRSERPELTVQVAYAKAIQALPRTSDRYQGIRQILQWRGVAALPLR
jgi:hypothetical protein